MVIGPGRVWRQQESVAQGGDGGNDALAWWPSPHGWVYMVYLVATALLGFELRWGLGKMVGVMLAGCVPFLSFWVEHRVAREARSQIEATEDAAGRVAA